MRDRHRPSADKRNSVMPASGSGNDSGGIGAARVPPIFRISVTETIGCPKYAFFRSLEVTRATDLVDEALRCVCQYCSTDD